MNLRQPAVLPSTSYLRAIRRETGGNIALTHLAVVADEQGIQRRAFVKHFPNQSHRGLFNEWFGYCMMSALGIPQPAGALIQAPIGGSGPLQWAYASFTPSPTYEGTPKEIYDLGSAAQCKELVSRLMACHSFSSMVAADQLCMNGDRNLGNLVFTGKKTFVVIDHGEILGGSAWTEDALRMPTTWVSSVPIDVCEHFAPLSPATRSAVCAGAEVTTEALWECFAGLQEAMGAKNQKDTALALDAVWWRSLELAGWFREKLQLML